METDRPAEESAEALSEETATDMLEEPVGLQLQQLPPHGPQVPEHTRDSPALQTRFVSTHRPSSISLEHLVTAGSQTGQDVELVWEEREEEREEMVMLVEEDLADVEEMVMLVLEDDFADVEEMVMEALEEETGVHPQHVPMQESVPQVPPQIVV